MAGAIPKTRRKTALGRAEATGAGNVKRPKAKRARGGAGAPATFVPPMKALSVESVPAGKWRLEIKFDGYRALAVVNGGKVELWSRNHKPLGPDYPEVAEAMAMLPCANAVVDGEIVALDEEGRSRFQLLQGRDRQARPTIVYYVFDLLHRDGRSLMAEPVERRQAELAELVAGAGDVVRVSQVFEAEPTALLEAARGQGLEGIIAKAAGSVYEPGRRSGQWLKCKVQGEQEFVVGGFTPPKNARPFFGALLVGYYEAGKLRYAGKVGSGYSQARLGELHAEMMTRRVERCPFSDLPTPRTSRFGGGMTAGMMREVTWVKPELVAQVRFTEWTSDGMLRHPVFLGLRRDKKARDVGRDRMAPGGRG